jgi:glyoxylate reductase
MKPIVYVTRRIPDQGLSLVLEHCQAEVWPEETPPPREVLLEKVGNCHGLLSLLTDKVDGALMDAAPNLRVVSNMAVGFDNIDVPAATERGILVGNTPEVLTDTTADFAFALLMAAARRIGEGIAYVHAGKWKTWGPMLLMGQDVHGATLGLIGLGRIGGGMARRAQGFNMRVLYYDVVRREDLEQQMNITYADLDTLLAESDFVSLHAPLTPETRHVINTGSLRKMKPTAVLVNTARGPLVDPRALYEALRDGVIAAAGLDVTDPEPIPMDDPLLTLPNCLIVPHIASASVATRGKMAELAARNLLAGLKGELLTTHLNPAALERRKAQA